MSEKHNVAIYHQTKTPIYEESDFLQINRAYTFAKASDWDVVAVYPDTPKGSVWPRVIEDFKAGSDFSRLLVTTEGLDPLIYDVVPQDPDEALKCGVADKPLPEPPCDLDKPCPVHEEATA
ncbi:hypothetical protein [Streptomyces sp. NPDC005336]|uniref:hypothetical protein n=1 Tax=Streptomyces sp. NPDC005336 TaxID=3157035 RepID=UPI0033A3600F